MLKKSVYAAFGLFMVLLSACSLPGGGRALDTTPGSMTTLCPQTGAARAAIAPTLMLGRHANLIYYYSDYSNPNDNGAVLKRADVVNNGTTQIARLGNADIVEAQVSADGQWILFVISVRSPHSHIELRLIRVDGQYQQTLFCLPQSDASPYGNSVGHFVWSPDNTSVALFGLSGTFHLPAIYLLDLVQGQVQLELESAIGPLQKDSSGETYPQYTEIYYPIQWLSNTHLYVGGFKELNSTAGPSRRTIYLLDTSKGSGQHTTDLQAVFSQTQPMAGLGACDFTSSNESSQFFIANCTSQGQQGGLFQGPSTITVQPANGGQAQTIYHTSSLAIDRIEAVGSRTLLFLSTDVPDNGYTGSSLWRINTDGSGLKRLAANGRFTWCSSLQDSCANVSRDGSLYALFSLSDSGDTLVYGSLNGGPLKTVAILNSLYEAFVGWTAMG